MRNFITIVSGLPRSGTSMTMQMLDAGGLPVLVDNVRPADEDNPRGYFEFEPVKRTGENSSWVDAARGRAVKMVYLLLRDLPLKAEYRVIMMRRDIAEVMASQRTMLRRKGVAGAGVSDERMGAIFERELKSIEQWLSHRRQFSVLNVNYCDCLRAPLRAAGVVDHFLGGGLDIQAMAAAVDRHHLRVSNSKELS